jgi:serine protease Do
MFYYGLPSGFYVTAVTEGGPADLTGIEAKDIILSIDGTRISGSADLDSVLYNYEPGDTLEITIYRRGRQYTGTITVGEAGKKE